MSRRKHSPERRQGWLWGGPPIGVGAPTDGLQVELELCGGAASLRFQVYAEDGAKHMGHHHNSLHDALPAGAEETLGRRWGDWLAEVYGRANMAKLIARDFDVSVRTAEVWLAGQAPYARHIVRALRLHGLGVVGAVLAPGTAVERLARVDQLADDLETKMQALGAEIAILRGPPGEGGT